MRRILFRDRSVQRAGKGAGRMRKHQIGIRNRQRPARCTAQGDTPSTDLLVESEGGRAGGWRRRKQGKTVWEGCSRQIAYEKARTQLGYGNRFAPGPVAGTTCNDRNARRDEQNPATPTAAVQRATPFFSTAFRIL